VASLPPVPALCQLYARPLLQELIPVHPRQRSNAQCGCRSHCFLTRTFLSAQSPLLITFVVSTLRNAVFPDVHVAGLADDPKSVIPGDMYCCVERITRSDVWDGHDAEAVAEAIEAGAAAILAQTGNEFPPGLVPEGVPVIYADEVDELAARLAAVLYGETAVSATPKQGLQGRFPGVAQLHASYADGTHL